MNRWRSIRNFLLVWLGNRLLCIGYALLVVALNGTPNWLDVLILLGWAAWASRWLASLAEWLERWWPVRWVAVAYS